MHVVILHILFCFFPVARILSFQKELHCLFYSLREKISTRIYITFLIFILMYICVYVVSVYLWICADVCMCPQRPEVLDSPRDWGYRLL